MFNVFEVSDAARASLIKHNNVPDDARRIFMGAIFDWTDNYSENLAQSPDSLEAHSARRSIAQLWIAYAAMEISLRQYKTAVQIFDDALADSLASSSVELYLSYAAFSKERGKIGNAQKVYLKGLSAITKLSSQDMARLWIDFLATMRESAGAEGADLTVETLFESVKLHFGAESIDIAPPSLADIEVVKQQLKADAIAAIAPACEASSDLPNTLTSNSMSNSNHVASAIGIDVAESKDDNSVDRSINMSSVEAQTTSSSTAAVAHTMTNITPNAAAGPTMSQEEQVSSADDLDDVSMYTPELLRSMFRSRPPVLFCTPEQEPLCSGMRSLSEGEINTLREFFESRFPILGGIPVCSEKLSRHLDVLHGLWTLQALKERHFDCWFTDLKALHRREESTLILREHGVVDGKLLSDDMKRLRSKCDVQRELLHATVNKTLFSALALQQKAIASLQLPFPCFSQSVTSKVVAIADGVSGWGSGAAADYGMDAQLQEDLRSQRRIIGSLLSLRIGPESHSAFIPSLILNHSRSVLKRAANDSAPPQGVGLSLGLGIAVPEDTTTEDADPLDYYSSEAKKKRKKRRMTVESPHSSPVSTPTSAMDESELGGEEGMSPVQPFQRADPSSASLRNVEVGVAVVKEELPRVLPQTGSVASLIPKELSDIAAAIGATLTVGAVERKRPPPAHRNGDPNADRGYPGRDNGRDVVRDVRDVDRNSGRVRRDEGPAFERGQYKDAGRVGPGGRSGARGRPDELMYAGREQPVYRDLDPEPPSSVPYHRDGPKGRGGDGRDVDPRYQGRAPIREGPSDGDRGYGRDGRRDSNTHGRQLADSRGPDLRSAGFRGPDPRRSDPRSTNPRDLDTRGFDPRGVDPRGVDPRGVDPRGVDPRGVDPRGVDPRGGDARAIRSSRDVDSYVDPRFEQPATGPRYAASAAMPRQQMPPSSSSSSSSSSYPAASSQSGADSAKILQKKLAAMLNQIKK